MQLTKIYKILIVITFIAILIFMYMFLNKKSVGQNSDNNVATTTTDGLNVITQGNNGYKIEQVSLDEGKNVPQPIPDLNRQITLYKGAIVAPEARAFAETKIKSLQTKLKTNITDLESWIYLGKYQKDAGDYEGAILSWKYVGKLAPNDYIALGNLGNLYGYFIKDGAQAEVYYKQAIAKSPIQVNLYIQLSDIYKDILMNKEKAKQIIDEGLKNVPNDPTLLQIKASLAS